LEPKIATCIISAGSRYFATRLNFLQGQNAEKKYDWIVILGGTNDLGHGLKPEQIFTGLEKIYKVALEHGARILALTVPECGVINKSLDERRGRLNALIKERKGNHL
jgi:lysophospholipase L1-like esterase